MKNTGENFPWRFISLVTTFDTEENRISDEKKHNAICRGERGEVRDVAKNKKRDGECQEK